MIPGYTENEMPLLSVSEYLETEESSAVKREYVAGQLFAPAGASERHNRVAGNIFAQLWTAARRGSCRVFMSDMKLRVSHDVFYYPDVMVVCESDEEPLYKTRPCLIVVVLSESTEAIDRREKRLAYQQLPSLQAYLLVSSDVQRVGKGTTVANWVGPMC